MVQTSYCIACKDLSGGASLWLGGVEDGSGTYWCDVEAGVPGPGAMEYWSIIPLPGTDACYLWNANANLYASFTAGGPGVGLRALDVHDPSFIMKLDDVGDGWVAINNSAKDGVFTAQQPTPGAPVLESPWKGGDYQMWRFVDANILPALAPESAG
ncbi:MAG TPA: hypothetical protein VGX37_00925 [Allosphingosinicella sp.]|jgi:hypothetical protein|nr:hypothetical protein [Allosphingosinicella sp.]